MWMGRGQSSLELRPILVGNDEGECNACEETGLLSSERGGALRPLEVGGRHQRKQMQKEAAVLRHRHALHQRA